MGQLKSKNKYQQQKKTFSDIHNLQPTKIQKKMMRWSKGVLNICVTVFIRIKIRKSKEQVEWLSTGSERDSRGDNESVV